MAETIFFIVFALGALGFSAAVLIAKNPINSAVMLVCSFFCLAGIYVMLSATFMAVIQILVYAGAIMVLFIFVLMLLNIRDDEIEAPRLSIHQGIAILAGTGIFFTIALSIAAWSGSSSRVAHDTMSDTFGTVEPIGDQLITSYVLPFEMAAILLLVGIVGAVVVAKKRF